jgi:hypothetical protein
MKSKFIFCFLLFGCWVGNLAGQNNNWYWAKSAAGGGEGLAVSSDTMGNAFITGIYGPTIIFGSTTLNSVFGSGDIYIAKYDPSGNFLWAKSAGGSNLDEGLAITTDKTGNAFVTGIFYSDSITFGSVTVFNSNSLGGSFDIFIAKYDMNGNVLWAKSFGGPDDDFGLGVATDNTGNVFLTGEFASPSISCGSTTLINASSSGTSCDLYLAKLDVNGNVIWAKSAGATGYDMAYSVATDTSGNIFLTGFFQDSTITFGSVVLTNLGVENIFIVKYDPGGNVLWATSAGGTSVDVAYSISADSIGNVYITGSFFSPNVNFGSYSLANSGSVNTCDMFIAKFDGNGNAKWAKSVGGANLEEGFSVSAGAKGNVFVTGRFTSTSITIGNDTFTDPNPGIDDPMFLINFDSTGNIFCAQGFDSGGDDQNGVSADSFGNAFITGDFMVNAFVLGSDTLHLTSGENVFVAKYVCQCNPVIRISGNDSICKGDSTTLTANGASTYVWFPGNISGSSITIAPLSTSTYSVVGTSSSGCSDTVSMTVTVNQSPFVALDLSAIDTQCVTINSVALSGGFPLGGIFGGTATSGNNFHPSVAGPGTFGITYYYLDSNSCVGKATDSIFVSPCVGISTPGDLTHSISIFPNPSNGNFTIKNNFAPNFEIVIFNSLGQKIYRREKINEIAFDVDLNNQPNGIYLVQIISDGKVYSQKILKE